MHHGLTAVLATNTIHPQYNTVVKATFARLCRLLVELR